MVENKKLVTGVVILVVIILLGVGAYFLYGKMSGTGGGKMPWSPFGPSKKVVLKTGNNGSASCDTYCALPYNGQPPYKKATGAVIQSTGKSIPTSQIADLNGNTPMNCFCTNDPAKYDGDLKVGNNGALSCTDFCMASGYNDQPAYKRAVGAVSSQSGKTVDINKAEGTPVDCYCAN